MELIARLGLDAADYISGLTKSEAAAAKFVKQQERTSLAIEKQVRALQDQSAALGFSERQIKIAELTLRGATDAQLKSADAALKQKEAFQEAAKAIANASAKAKATTDATAAIDKQVKALHDQVAVQGRSERQAKLYALEQAGATQEQLKSASAALKQKAAYEATTKFMRDLGKAALYVGAALGGAAVAGALLFEKFVGKAASFQDLAEKTGASAEALASFQVAASVTNTSMDTLANLSVKLTKGLAGTDEETKQAANAIKQLGLNVEDFKKLDPAAQFEVIGKRLNEFADGSGKTAFAVAAMGRAGADALPFLKELGAQGQRNVILTAAQIKAADDYKDAQARLRAEVVLYATRLAIDVLPVVQDFQKALFETAKQILGVSTEASKLAGNNDVEEFASKAARGLAVLIDGVDLVFRGFELAGAGIAGFLAQLDQLQRFDFKGLARVQAEARERVNAIIDRPSFSSNLAAQQAASARERELASDPERRRLLGTVGAFRPKPELDPRKFGGGGGANDAANKAAQLAKKQLDEQISQLENFIKQEDRLLEERNHTLDRLYDQDRISSEDYFSGRIKALDKQVFEKADIYREEIDNLKRFVDDTKDQTLKLAALKEIGTKTEQQADFLSDSSRKATKLRDDAEKALAAYGTRVEEVRLKVLELSKAEGSAGEVAARRFDASNADLLSKANLKGDEETKRNLALLRQREVSQADINKLLQDAQVIETRLGTTEARLHLDRNLGLRDEITTLDLLGKSSVEAAAKLQIIADKYLAIAQASDSEVLIANAEAFKQKINEMAAATDILAAQFRKTFVDTGASAIETFLNSVAEGKNVLDSFKNAFTQFANDIIRQINRIAAQNIADSLFKSGSGGGGGGIFSSIADAFVKYIGGLGGGSTAASNFGMNVREKGGPVSGRTPYIVGERGPEIFVPRTVAAAANKQIDSLIAQKGKPAQYTDRVKAATVATTLPHLIGAKGPEIFVPKVDGIVIPNDKVNKLSRVLQGRAKGGPVVSATPYIVGERGPEIFTPRNVATIGPHEKIVTRLVSIVRPKASQVASNMPSVVGARGPELFVSKAAGIIQNDKVAKIASAFERKASQASASAAAGAAPATRRREISAPLAAARTILRDEKIITRYANAPYSRPVATHVPSIGRREIFIPKPAKAAVQRDEAVSKLSTSVRGKAGGAAVVEKFKNLLTFQWGSGGAQQPPQEQGGRGTSASVASRWSAASAAITSRWSSSSAAKASRIISERAPQVYIQQSATEIRNRAATGLGLPPVIGAHQPTRDLARPALKLAARIGIVPTLTEPSKRVVAKLVLDAPHQRRADGGPVEASTPYVVGELGPELFMPKSAERVINNEKARDDLVSNNIQHRASSAPKVTYLGERGHEIFISKLASTNIKNEKLITDLVSNNVQHGASVKNQKIQNDLVSNTRTEKIINQLVLNKQRGPFAAHQAYLVGRPELVVRKSAEKIIKNENLVSELVTNNVKRNEKIINDLVANSVHRRERVEPAHQTYFVGEHGREILVSKSARKAIKNKQVVDDLVSNTVQRRAIGSPSATRTPYIVDKFGAEVFMPKAAANHVQELRNVRGSHYGLFPALELGLTSAYTPLRALNFKETDHVSTASSRINKNEMVHNDLVSNTRNEKTINQLVSNIKRRTELESYGQKDHRADNSFLESPRFPELYVPQGGPTFLTDVVAVRDGPESRNGNWVKNEKVIYDLVTNTIQHKAQGGPVQAPHQTYLVGERGSELFVTKSAEKIIKNDNRVSELVTNNSRRNEKVINDLVSKTVHHREIAGPVAAPNVAAKIIKNESRISELVSNDVQRNEEIINRLATTTRRDSGGSNQLLVVGAHGPELFIPKAAGSIIKNERRINELVSNIEHRNIDRSSEKTIDEIIASTVQRRAHGGPVVAYQKYRERLAEVPKAAGRVINSEAVNIADIGSNIQRRANGGPVSAYQQYLVGERGPELYVPKDGEIKVPSDFFTNEQHHRAFGGPVAANRPFIVGERGPEWFVPKTAGTVVANSKSGGMGNPTFIFNMSGGGNMNRQTQQQLFADAAQAFARSSRRLN